MMECTDHPAYRLIDTFRKKGAMVDYVILQHDGGDHGIEEHLLAADTAMRHIAERWEEYVAATMAQYPHMKYKQFRQLHWDAAMASAKPYSIGELLARPEDPYYLEKPRTKCRTISTAGGEYACAFLEPPYANGLLVRDWELLNSLLFSSPASLEAYRWTDNWSNYFDDGKEWWGTFFWTVHDGANNRFVVIAASNTD